MTNANTNTGNLNPFFHPAAHYASPEGVLNDDELSGPEKRIILSSWASDMFAVESCPALREIPGMGHTIRLADILAALRRLDGDDDPPPPGGVPMRLRRPWAAALRSPAGACFGDVGRLVHCIHERVG
ncbi:hypothetical protein [Bradyrhizobium japonicum]|uniref:hypothetical protein n=1 Tax=Bradyrhizobium japonicum TaxID=375 RepID=UPI00209FCA29|nr:hypothetical protein [Bradyrhizobium japonicum]MCP1767185.1 hypothetical protein [Bradyrhizobium japonicum]MCP1789324.1 hypothetical protein [Bradyrhizobium japonicum]MCP1801823.1 hypothetical protein [Bradyrhizobium japonicum]MCP1820134.1 hypothetical protein [Bradyrhizobium japonicum]MCP1868358.1 hypothetical protein [Bradyrhizobium japonicum]